MFLERQDALLGFAHEECPGPVPTDQRLIRPFHVPIPGIALEYGTQFPKSSLHVAKSRVHLVRRISNAWIYTQAGCHVVVLCKLPGPEFLILRHVSCAKFHTVAHTAHTKELRGGVGAVGSRSVSSSFDRCELTSEVLKGKAREGRRGFCQNLSE